MASGSEKSSGGTKLQASTRASRRDVMPFDMSTDEVPF
jgi:hypothetical protein